MTSPSKAKRAKLEVQKHEIRNVFALVLVNEKFPGYGIGNRDGADADRKKIKEFCKKAKFTVNHFSDLNLMSDAATDLKTDDLAADEMEDLFKTISKGDFSDYDAFICFISSHGDSGGILGVDGDSITMREIVRPIKRCPSLIGKPKLFFIQSCRGYKKDTARVSKGMVVADSSGYPQFTIPIEADILVAYSSLDGYELYRSENEGSWFITVLTQVFNEYAQDMNLTDMLAIVHEMVAGMEHCGRKQTPLFMSTLRKAVCFRISEPIE